MPMPISSDPAGTEAASVGLLAVRVASIIRRAMAGATVDAADRQDLRDARDSLLASLAATRSQGVARPRALTRQLTSMGLMFAAARTSGRKQDPAEMASSLEALAEDLARLVRRQQLNDPESLYRYYQRLATRARQESSSSGERVIRTPG